MLSLKARKRLTEEIAILRASEPTRPVSLRQETTADDTPDVVGVLRKKKSIRQMVSDVSVQAAKSPSMKRRNTDAAISISNEFREVDNGPAVTLGKGPIKEVHSMTARRTAYSPRRSPSTPSSVPPESTTEEFLKCAGAECAIM
jgi:hypothetical protein